MEIVEYLHHLTVLQIRQFAIKASNDNMEQTSPSANMARILQPRDSRAHLAKRRKPTPSPPSHPREKNCRYQGIMGTSYLLPENPILIAAIPSTVSDRSCQTMVNHPRPSPAPMPPLPTKSFQEYLLHQEPE